MSNLEQDAQENQKKVLRIAIVGVRPADQIMIKGYLRVLLRLHVELEWVSAKHPQVDLFLISNDFRYAANIKILQGQRHKPVLYTSRTSTGEGELVDDRLVLPLKSLHQLDAWLMSTVPVLMRNTEAEAPESQGNKALVETDSDHQVSAPDAHAAIHGQASSSQTTDNDVLQSDTTQVGSARSSAGSDQSVINFIQALHKKPAGLYQIVVDNQTVAIAEPSRARVWLRQSENVLVSPSSCHWQLSNYQGVQPPAADAQDLVQWLWRCAWGEVDPLLPLINDDILYQLRHWIKPVSAVKHSTHGSPKTINKSRRELLQVMNALEKAPCDVNELSRLASISVKNVKKIIAGLLFAGALKSEHYEHLDTSVSRSVHDKPHEVENAATSSVAVEPAVAEPTENSTKQTALEALLERRARGEVSTPTTSSVINVPDDMANKETAKPSAAQQEKRGFLARLRQKLGL